MVTAASKPRSQRKPFSERRANDWYPTPQALADAAIAYLPAPTGRAAVLDPGSGTGVWGYAARKAWGDRAVLHGVDIAMYPPAVYNIRHLRDFVNYAKTTAARYDYVIGNPPYNIAESFVSLGYKLLKPGGHMAYLLRLNFLGGQGRGRGLFQTTPPRHVFVSCKRPDFTGGGGDMTEYAVFWWTKDWDKPTTLSWFDYTMAGKAQQVELFAATAGR